MWFLRNPPKKTTCFFCKIEVDAKDAFALEYTARDGKGKVELCPMCAGMLDDMSEQVKDLYND